MTKINTDTTNNKPTPLHTEEQVLHNKRTNTSNFKYLPISTFEYAPTYYIFLGKNYGRFTS